MAKHIGVETPDGVMGCYVARPTGNLSWPAVIFYMDAGGVRRSMIAMAERISAAGYYVVLPDLYYRHGEVPPFDMATVFSPGPERDRLMKLAGSVTPANLVRDTAALLDFLSRQAEVLGDAVGCTGYCMGGRCALTAAGNFPDRIAAAASFHGGRLATDAPDSPHLLAPRMRARVYIGVAGIDPGFPPAELARLEAALQAAHIDYKAEVYDGVSHGWAVSDTPVFDPPAAERHWERLLGLFDTTLRPGLMRPRPE